MGDLFNRSGRNAVLGSAASPVTLGTSYTIAKSALVDISKSSSVLLFVNYTQGSGETVNTLSFIYELADGSPKQSRPTLTANTLAFVNADPDTITDSGNGFLAAGFAAGQIIDVSGAATAANNRGYQIEAAVAGTLTLRTTEDPVTAESAGALITIKARSGPFYRLQTEAQTAGAIARANREDTWTTAATAGDYDRFVIKLENLGAAEFLRVYVKEGGVASNAGSCWIEAATLGR